MRCTSRLRVAARSLHSEADHTARSVALVDFQVDGHHSSYAVMLGRELRSMGWRVVAVGSADFVAYVAAAGACDATSVVASDKGRGVSGIKARVSGIKARAGIMARTLRAAHDQGCESVHILYADGYLVSLVLALPGSSIHYRQLVLSFHGLYFLPQYTAGVKNLVAGIVNGVSLCTMYHKGAHVTVHADVFAKALQGWPWFISAERLHYPGAHAGEDVVAARARRESIRAMLGIDSDVRLMLAFGRTDRLKGSLLAVESLQYLPPSFHLAVVGSEEEVTESALMQAASLVGVAGRVHLHLGFVPEEDVLAWFVASDCLVLPYAPRFPGISASQMIAARCALPSIVSSAPGLREYVEDYHLGRVFTPYDAPSLAREVKVCGCGPLDHDVVSRFCRDHSPAAFAAKLDQLYLASGA
jgi:glycosyltransferase involved in cell wall biosynthesis